jgi:hypothetical protein
LICVFNERNFYRLKIKNTYAFGAIFFQVNEMLLELRAIGQTKEPPPA